MPEPTPTPVSDDEPAQGDREDAVDAYRRQKEAQLSDVGEERLRRELAELESFLDDREAHEEGDPSLYLDVDVEYRRRKAEVLREILSEAQEDRADAGDEAED